MLHILPHLILVGFVIAAFFYLVKVRRQTSRQYDERQLLLQKQAYTNAAWTVLLVDLAIAIEGAVLEQYLSLSFVGFLNIFLLVAIYAVSSILTDAYFLATNKKRMIVLYVLVCSLQVFTFYRQWTDGDFTQDGHLYLTDRASTLLAALTFGAILLATLYKVWKEKREGGDDA